MQGSPIMTNRNKLEEPEEKSRIRSVCYTNDTVLTELEEKKKAMSQEGTGSMD